MLTISLIEFLGFEAFLFNYTAVSAILSTGIV